MKDELILTTKETRLARGGRLRHIFRSDFLEGKVFFAQYGITIDMFDYFTRDMQYKLLQPVSLRTYSSNGHYGGSIIISRLFYNHPSPALPDYPRGQWKIILLDTSNLERLKSKPKQSTLDMLISKQAALLNGRL